MTAALFLSCVLPGCANLVDAFGPCEECRSAFVAAGPAGFALREIVTTAPPDVLAEQIERRDAETGEALRRQRELVRIAERSGPSHPAASSARS